MLLVVVGDSFYFFSEDGDIFVVKVGEIFEEFVVNLMDDLLMVMLVIFCGVLYVCIVCKFIVIGSF